MRISAMAITLAGLALAGCHDKGAEPIAFCQERLEASPDGLTCSAHYLICAGTFGCSWRVDCSVNERGSTTCRCSEDPAKDCNLGGTWDVEGNACALVDAGERKAFRDAAASGCFGDQVDDVDFSRLP